MKACQLHKKKIIWLLSAIILMAAYFLLRMNRTAIGFLALRVFQPIKTGIGFVLSFVPLPVVEILSIVLAGIFLYQLYCFFVRIRHGNQQQRQQYGIGFLIGVAAAALSLVNWYFYSWGANYYAPTFQQQTGFTAEEVTVEELQRVTALFLEGANQLSAEVQRNEEGLFDEPMDEIFSSSVTIYDNSIAEFPVLDGLSIKPKKMLVPQLFSYLGFTGYYAGFTGESVINCDQPSAFIPATITHELAHQRGFASEQECNFIGIITAINSDHAAYQYSGYLMGYIHLSNALYAAAPEAYKEVRSAMLPAVLLDIEYNNTYWRSHETVVREFGQQTYDTVLKSQGQVNGIKSYGTVVDLLVTYY